MPMNWRDEFGNRLWSVFFSDRSLGSSVIARRGRKGLLPALITGVFAFPLFSWAQISLVQATPCGPGTFPISCAIPSTGRGHLIVVGIELIRGVKAGTTISRIADNAGDTYFEAGSALATDASDGAITDIWYAKNTTAGATAVTIAPSTEVSSAGAVLWEFSGVDTNSPLDQTVALSSQPATSTPTGGPVKTLAASVAIVSIAEVQNCLTGIVSGNTFTNDSKLFCDGWAHLVTSAAGTYTAQWREIPSGIYAASTASFKVAGGDSSAFKVAGGGSNAYSPCDLNQDGVVNVVDLQIDINAVLNLGCSAR